jgi:hypothetical protein
MGNVSDKSCRENKNTHFNNSFLIVRLGDKLEKYCKAGQATDDNIA